MAALVQGVLFLAAAAGSHPARADMIDTSGMQPWEICGLCHSLDGISAMARFPKLAGQRPDYIIKQFRDFHGGSRQNDGGQMQAITTEIDMEELPEIAAYFADLPPPPAVEPDDTGGLASAGALFREGRGDIPACLSCHGGTDPDLPLAPWLEAQHADYLAKQLNDFRQGNRSNDPDGVMRSIATRLSETDIETLTAFIAGQERPERTP
ncbi:c-type cytochrome [Roseibium sp. Sym1]|uniref:c-type cytochrome n=1 Tax=Roseibium sp. Sym1 TaxID=3016006 RepID=UPI0022B49A3C|nr:cytochrome C [Roseibium sp. Sym1]